MELEYYQEKQKKNVQGPRSQLLLGQVILAA